MPGHRIFSTSFASIRRAGPDLHATRWRRKAADQLAAVLAGFLAG